MFDYTAIADRVKTVSLSNCSHPTVVVNLELQLPKAAVQSKGHTFKMVNNPTNRDSGSMANQRGEVMKISARTFSVINIVY